MSPRRCGRKDGLVPAGRCLNHQACDGYTTGYDLFCETCERRRQMFRQGELVAPGKVDFDLPPDFFTKRYLAPWTGL